MTARENAAKQLSPKNDYFCGVTSAQTLQIVFTLEKIMSFKDNTNKLQIKLTPVAGQPTAADGSTIYEVERIGSGNGTPLNAKTLNDEFAKKQDKLTTVYDGGIAIDNNNISISPDIINLIKNGQSSLEAGTGITIVNGVISATGESHPDYTSIVPQISTPKGYYGKFADWKIIAYDPRDIEFGKEYGFIDGYEDQFALEFRLDDMHFSDKDTDPTVMVRIDGNSSIYCLFRLKKGAVRIVSAKDWKNVTGQLSCTEKMPTVLAGDNISVKIERLFRNTNDEYSFYFDGDYLGKIIIPTIGGGRVKFGTIGCKAAVVRDWKIRRIDE